MSKHMQRIAIASLLLFLSLAFSSVSLAQKPNKLEADWLDKDIKSIELIAKLMPLENQTIENIKAILGANTSGEEENLGFGAQRFSLSKGNGYTSFRVDAFILNGYIKYYQIGVGTSSDSWPLIRDYIVKAWRQNGGPEFEENEYGLAYQKTLDIGFQAYQKAVAAELGEVKAVDVPADLKDSYDELISPLNNSVVGFGACGYGGVVPQGKEAIDSLVKAKRVDLIENLLRGYNPGGRVYAALALLEMKKQGLRLSNDTPYLINKIRSLNIKIETCSGCIITYRTAKEILEAPEAL